MLHNKGEVILSCLFHCAGEQGYSMLFDPWLLAPCSRFVESLVCDFQYAKV